MRLDHLLSRECAYFGNAPIEAACVHAYRNVRLKALLHEKLREKLNGSVNGRRELIV